MSSGSDTPPNIILIHSHNSGQYYGCYGRDIETPSIDQLAADGIQFSNAFCSAAQCSPSRSSMMTGLYPHRNGMLGLAHLGWELHPSVQTLPAILSAHGYESHLFGVEHAGIGPEGYDQPHESENTATAVSEAVDRFLSEYSYDSRPFFISAGFFESHRRRPDFYWTYDVPAYETDSPDTVTVPDYLPDKQPIREEFGALNGMIRAIDAGVNRIMSAIETAGLEDDTLVIFMSDHGIEMPRAMGTCYDPGLEIAWVMRYPDRIPAGTVHDGLVSNVDLVPTVLQIADIPVPPELDGVDLSPVFADPAEPVRDHIFAEMTWHDRYNPMRAVRTDRFKYIRNFGDLPEVYMPISSIFTDSGLTLLEDCYADTRPAEECYDLDRDPHEQTNLIDDPEYDPTVTELRSMVQEWMEESADPLLEGPVEAPEAQIEEMKKYPYI